MDIYGCVLYVCKLSHTVAWDCFLTSIFCTCYEPENVSKIKPEQFFLHVQNMEINKQSHAILWLK